MTDELRLPTAFAQHRQRTATKPIMVPSTLTSEDAATPIGQIGEDGVLSVFLDALGAGGVLAGGIAGPGDDCALMQPSNRGLLMSTDMMVESVDFRRSTFSAFELGWKIAAVNLSDIGAMGGTPTAMAISAALPDSLPAGDVVHIAQGIVSAIHELAPQTRIIGGDLSSGAEVVINATVFGEPTDAVVQRKGAHVGDLIAVAGQLGWAYVGWKLLDQDTSDGIGNVLEARQVAEDAERAVMAQRAPQPPVSLGRAAAQAGATAMIDVSDGLLQDAQRISTASRVTINLDPIRLAPFIAALTPVAEAAHVEPKSAVFGGGEDFALLASFPPSATLPSGFTTIGHVVASGDSPTVIIGDSAAHFVTGWSHFHDHAGQ